MSAGEDAQATHKQRAQETQFKVAQHELMPFTDCELGIPCPDVYSTTMQYLVRNTSDLCCEACLFYHQLRSDLQKAGPLVFRGYASPVRRIQG